MNESSLRRYADRLEAGKVADFVETHLEMGTVFDRDQSSRAMLKLVRMVRNMISQSVLLQQEAESVAQSLMAEKRMNVLLEVDKHQLQASSAALEKQNRKLKAEIENLVRHGRV